MSRRPRILQANALLLLAVFMAGGVLVPVLHRVHHGLTWAHLRGGTAAACDHARHDDSVEQPVSSFQEDPCPLCQRHVDYALQPSLTSVETHWDDTPAAQGSDPAASLAFLAFLIRGPPRRA